MRLPVFGSVAGATRPDRRLLAAQTSIATIITRAPRDRAAAAWRQIVSYKGKRGRPRKRGAPRTLVLSFLLSIPKTPIEGSIGALIGRPIEGSIGDP